MNASRRAHVGAELRRKLAEVVGWSKGGSAPGKARRRCRTETSNVRSKPRELRCHAKESKPNRIKLQGDGGTGFSQSSLSGRIRGGGDRDLSSRNRARRLVATHWKEQMADRSPETESQRPPKYPETRGSEDRRHREVHKRREANLFSLDDGGQTVKGEEEGSSA